MVSLGVAMSLLGIIILLDLPFMISVLYLSFVIGFISLFQITFM